MIMIHYSPNGYEEMQSFIEWGQSAAWAMNRMLSDRCAIVHMKVSVQIAVQGIGETIHTFELKRRMRNIIAMLKDLADLMLDLRACTNVKVIGKDMGGHRAQALGETPHMDVMNAEHAINLGNLADHCLHIHIARRGLEQDVDGIPQNAPGDVKDEDADQYAHERIKPIGIGEINDHTRNHRSYGGD